MRKLIAGMKMSVDGKIEGPAGVADWVEAWSEDYGLTSEIDACVLGGGMYPGYETYWTAVQNASGNPLPMTGTLPTKEEIEWGRFAARTPHYVLSRTLTSALWPNTGFLRDSKELDVLKQQPGKDIYLIGGARVTASLVDAALLDELRIILYPLIAGEGKALFATIEHRHALKLRKVRQLQGGRVSLIYDLG
jgi:dihydrofolate reductase